MRLVATVLNGPDLEYLRHWKLLLDSVGLEHVLVLEGESLRWGVSGHKN